MPIEDGASVDGGTPCCVVGCAADDALMPRQLVTITHERGSLSARAIGHEGIRIHERASKTRQAFERIDSSRRFTGPDDADVYLARGGTQEMGSQDHGDIAASHCGRRQAGQTLGIRVRSHAGRVNR